jgi:hypothetical protein
MFFPVTVIENLPHILLHYNFSCKKDRYFLSSYEVEISKSGSQKTVCEIIRSSDFLCGLLGIDRSTINNSPASDDSETTIQRALSCSITSEITNTNDSLLTLIEQRLDFKHRCMFYPTGPTSDLCG